MAKLKSELKTKPDRIRDVSPRYSDLISANNKLHERYEELIAEIKPLGEEQRRSQVSWTAQLPKPKQRPIVRHAGAVALVGALIGEPTLEEVATPPVRQSWPGEQRLAELAAESESVAEAIKLLQPALAAARHEYSKMVAAERGEEYQSLVEKIVDAANALGNSMIEHYKFLDGQRQHGVAYSNFRPLNLEVFGDLSEDFSPLRRLILDAIEKRHVGAGKIQDWRTPCDLAYLQVY